MRATRIAPRAIEALRAGSGWKILSSHKHAVNFVDLTGRLLSLTQDRIRMGPFSIEVESTPAGLQFDPRADRISIAMDAQARVHLAGLTLDLHSAADWDPRPRWSQLAATPWQPEILPVLLARLRASAPSRSLACVIDLLVRDRANPVDVSLQELPQMAAATSAVRVVRALAEGDLQAALSTCAALAGTGIGLTPSGDDFLVGVMFGLQSALPDPGGMALSRKIYRAGAGRTTRISEAWLEAAAEGQAIQAWHNLVESILAHERLTVDGACQNLIELGHTSGADALAGFAALHLARDVSLSAPQELPPTRRGYA